MDTQTVTLTDFLLARIAEDEKVARAAVIPAHSGPWKPHPEYAEWFYREDGEVEYVQTVEALAHKYPDRLYVTCDSEGLSPSVEPNVGEHIARHDPARILAECEAKRQIVEWAADRLRHFESTDVFGGWPDVQALQDGERLLEVLALPYADHPDYRDEWRP